MVRKCSKCGLEKNLLKFYQRKRGPRAGEYYEKCKDCMKIRGRTYYHSNRERQLKLAIIRRLKYTEERRRVINELKNLPCLDCEKIYPPWVMDFDHREGTKKRCSISQVVHTGRLWKLSKIKKEMKKCDLVCANCHRQRTYDRIQKRKFAAVANVVKALV